MISWLFADLNSYFASVEQQDRPELRGKPIGVVPMMAETTCCIAASYEAKAFGVKTGTQVSDARKMCKGIQFVEARPEIYMQYHHKIVTAVESCLPVTAVCSVDEMACRLTGRDQKESNAIALAHEVKQSIYKQVGEQMSCSIGIAPNRFLAKVASDMQKPNGLTLIRSEDLPHILYPLKLRDLPGIGYGMEKRLTDLNIKTVEQLLSFDKRKMHNIWGSIIGERFHDWLKGADYECPTYGIFEAEHPKSIGHSNVLAPELRNRKSAWSVAQRLTQKAAMRLRREGLFAKAFSIHVSFIGKSSWGENLRIEETQDTPSILSALEVLWKRMPEGATILKLGVVLYNLVSAEESTRPLFSDKQKKIELSHVVDSINSRYGKNTALFAGGFEAKDAVSTKIAFTYVPTPEDFDL